MPTQTLVLLVADGFALIAIAMIAAALFTVEQRAMATLQTVRVADPKPLPELRAAASERSVPGNGG